MADVLSAGVCGGLTRLWLGDNGISPAVERAVQAALRAAAEAAARDAATRYLQVLMFTIARTGSKALRA
eukprot:SAG22_NODE_16054_length_334_cov_0.485106_1_plen_68_part_01